MTPTAPAFWASCSFVVKPQVPRWISAILPDTADVKSAATQPLVLPPSDGTSVWPTVTTSAVTVFAGVCSKAMKSTAGLPSSAALPGT